MKKILVLTVFCVISIISRANIVYTGFSFLTDNNNYSLYWNTVNNTVFYKKGERKIYVAQEIATELIKIYKEM